MALLAFKVEADYQEAIRLREECERLEHKMQSMELGSRAWRSLNGELMKARNDMMKLCEAAAASGNEMQKAFFIKDNEIAKEIADTTSKLETQRATIKQLREEYNQYVAEYHRARLSKADNQTLQDIVQKRNAAFQKINGAKGEEDSILIKLTQLNADRITNAQEGGLVKYMAEAKKASKDAYGSMSQYFEDAVRSGSEVVNVLEKIASTAAGVSVGNLISGGITAGVDQLRGMYDKAVKIRAEMQDIESNMAVFLKSKDSAAAFTQQLSDAAYYNMNEFHELVSASKQMLAYGVKVNDIVPTIQKLSEIQVGTGGNLAQIVGMYNRAKSIGYVDSRTQQSWASQGIILKDELMKMGDTSGGSKITFDQLNKVIDSMTSEGGMFHGVQAEMMSNISAEEGQMDDQLHTMYDEMGKVFGDIAVQSYRIRGEMAENWREIADVVGQCVVVLGSYRAALVMCNVAHEAFVGQGGGLTDWISGWAEKLENLAEAAQDTKNAGWQDLKKLFGIVDDAAEASIPSIEDVVKATENYNVAMQNLADTSAMMAEVEENLGKDSEEYANAVIAEQNALEQAVLAEQELLDIRQRATDAGAQFTSGTPTNIPLENLKQAESEAKKVYEDAMKAQAEAIKNYDKAMAESLADPADVDLANAVADAREKLMDATETSIEAETNYRRAQQQTQVVQDAQTASTNVNSGAQGVNTRARQANTGATNANTGAVGANTTGDVANAGSKNLLTAAIKRTAGAMLKLTAATLTCPYTWIAAGVALVCWGLYELFTAESESEKATRALTEAREADAKAMQQQEEHLRNLMKMANKEANSSWERAEALEQLREEYQKLIDLGAIEGGEFKQAWTEEVTDAKGNKQTVYHGEGYYVNGERLEDRLPRVTINKESIDKELAMLADARNKALDENKKMAMEISRQYFHVSADGKKIESYDGESRQVDMQTAQQDYREFLNAAVQEEEQREKMWDENKDSVKQMALQMQDYYKSNLLTEKAMREQEENDKARDRSMSENAVIYQQQLQEASGMSSMVQGLYDAMHQGEGKTKEEKETNKEPKDVAKAEPSKLETHPDKIGDAMGEAFIAVLSKHGYVMDENGEMKTQEASVFGTIFSIFDGLIQKAGEKENAETPEEKEERRLARQRMSYSQLQEDALKRTAMAEMGGTNAQSTNEELYDKMRASTADIVDKEVASKGSLAQEAKAAMEQAQKIYQDILAAQKAGNTDMVAKLQEQLVQVGLQYGKATITGQYFADNEQELGIRSTDTPVKYSMNDVVENNPGEIFNGRTMEEAFFKVFENALRDLEGRVINKVNSLEASRVPDNTSASVDQNVAEEEQKTVAAQGKTLQQLREEEKTKYRILNNARRKIEEGNFDLSKAEKKYISEISAKLNGTNITISTAIANLLQDQANGFKLDDVTYKEVNRILGENLKDTQDNFTNNLKGKDIEGKNASALADARKKAEKEINKQRIEAIQKQDELELALMEEGAEKRLRQRDIEHRKALLQADKQYKEQLAKAEQQAKDVWVKANKNRGLSGEDFELGKESYLAQSDVYQRLKEIADDFYKTQVKLANLKYDNLTDLLDKYATTFDKEKKRIGETEAAMVSMMERYQELSNRQNNTGESLTEEEDKRLGELRAKRSNASKYDQEQMTEEENKEYDTLLAKQNAAALTEEEKIIREQIKRTLDNMPSQLIGSTFKAYQDEELKTAQAITDVENHVGSLNLLIEECNKNIAKTGDNAEMKGLWQKTLNDTMQLLQSAENKRQELLDKSMNEYVQKYGTTAQKVALIETDYNKKIANERDAWRKAALKKEMTQKVEEVYSQGAKDKNENYLRRKDDLSQARQTRAQQHEESIADLKGKYDKATTKEDKQRYADLITQEERQAKIDDNEFLTQGLNLSLEELKEDPQYFMAMTDAANATTEGLKRTKEMLEQLLLMGKDLDPKDYEALTNALNKVGDEYAGRNPFRGWLEASKEGANATKELEKAQKEQAVEQEKYDLLGAYKAPKPELERKEGESDEEFKKRQEEADKQWEENRNKSINEYVSRRDSAETAHDAAWTEMQIAGNVYDEVMADPTAAAEQQAEAEQRLAEAKQQELDTSIALQQTESDLTVAREGKGTTQAYVQQETNLTNAKKKTAKAEADKLKADQKGAKATQKLGSDLNKLGGGISAVGDSIAKADAKTAEFIKGTGAFVQSIGSGITQIGKVATAEVKGMEAACAWLMIVAAAIQATMWILDVIGVFDQDTTYQDAKEQYDELVKVWDTLISRKKEYLNESWGQEALNVGKEIEKLQKDQQEAARKLALKYWESGADASAHSYGYRQNRDLHQFFGEWSAAAGVTIRTIEDLASLSGEQLKKVQEANAFAWTQIDSEARDALEDIIKAEDALKDSTDELKEHILGISFNSLYDDFVGNMMDMQYSAADAIANINKMMMQALLNNVIGAQMKKKLEGFYNMFYDTMKTNNGLAMTESQIKELKNQYVALTEEAIEQRDMLAKITGYEDTASGGSNGGTGGIAANVSQDSIDEMTGRLTSVQMIAQSIAQSQDIIGQSIITLTQSMLDNMRQNAMEMTNHFEGIAEQIAETFLEIQAIHEDTTVMRGAVKTMERLMSDWDNNIKTL